MTKGNRDEEALDQELPQAKVQRVLDDVNSYDSEGLTKLHRAVLDNNLELITELFNNGADPFKPVNMLRAMDHAKAYIVPGDTILHIVLACGNDNLTIMLAKQFPKLLDIPNNKNFLPLHNALVYSNEVIVPYLISENNINSLADNLGSPLHVAVTKHLGNSVHTLLEHGAEINVKGENGQTPLYLAACSLNVEIGNILMENDADVNAVTTLDSFSPLHRVAWRHHLSFLKKLILNDANIEAKDSSGQTAQDYLPREGGGKFNNIFNIGADMKYVCSLKPLTQIKGNYNDAEDLKFAIDFVIHHLSKHVPLDNYKAFIAELTHKYSSILPGGLFKELESQIDKEGVVELIGQGQEISLSNESTILNEEKDTTPILGDNNQNLDDIS